MTQQQKEREWQMGRRIKGQKDNMKIESLWDRKHAFWGVKLTLIQYVYKYVLNANTQFTNLTAQWDGYTYDMINSSILNNM